MIIPARYTEVLDNLLNNTQAKADIDLAMSTYPLYATDSTIVREYGTAYAIPTRQELNDKILNHYRFREIGQETFGRWLFELETALKEIMPKYNQLFYSADQDYNPIYNVDYKKTIDRNRKDNTVGTQNSKTSTSGADTNEEYGKAINSKTPQNQLSISNTGIDSVNYGSIFVYKNGFRVYPYGTPGVDFFRINERKSQGYNRFLGTRELMGRVLIDGENEKFIEKSSRDGGFIENPATIQLEEFFIVEVVRILEKYVVDGIDWGDPERNKFVIGENEQGLTSVDVADKIIMQFANLTKRGDIISAEINPELIKLAQPKEDSLQKSIKGLEKIAEVSNSDDVRQLVTDIKKETQTLKKEKQKAEKTVETISTTLRQKETELKTREKQNANLQAKLKIDPIQYEDALHIIYVISEANLAELETIYKLADRENKKLIEKIVNTINNNRRIFKLSDLSLNYDYGISMKTPKDLVEIVRKYVSDFWVDQIAVSVETSEPDEKLICNFDISKISLLVDNFISNSKKAKAKNVNIQIKKNGGWIVMRFSDDGVGLDKSITNVDSIFERGYSTTFGFGLGLYHAKKVVTEMRGTIQVIPNTESGFALEVAFKYECKF